MNVPEGSRVFGIKDDSKRGNTLVMAMSDKNLSTSAKLNPILHPVKREHQHGENYALPELRLANRNSGIHLETMRHDVTPIGMHYLLSHFDIPYVDSEASWTLSVTGLVKDTQSLGLQELRALPFIERMVTLECAGNGRALHDPRWQSMPWNCEAVGTASWGGARLADVLALAGVKSEATELVFCGADKGVDGGDLHAFERSLSLEQAASMDVMLVWEINGQALPPQHGFPLRVIVPGWYGMASVKWLKEIRVTDRPFTGHQQTGTYIYRTSEDDPGVPVTDIRVKSLMIPPGLPDWYTRERLLGAGEVELYGRAWSGAGRSITRVEVAISPAPDEDNQSVAMSGLSELDWQEASIDAGASPYAWSAWRLSWQAEPGHYHLLCRATDDAGNTQPLTPPPDRGGFGNNVVQCVSVWVEEALP